MLNREADSLSRGYFHFGLNNLNYRDITDSTRKIATLKKAYDAHSIDVSDLSIDQVFEKVLSIIEK